MRNANWLGRQISSSYRHRFNLFGYQFEAQLARSVFHQILFLERERAVHERKLIESLVSTGDRVVDVGANIGYYLLLFEKLAGPTGHVFCVEPEEDNLRELNQQLSINNFQNVTIHPCAAGASNAEVGFIAGLNGRCRPEASAGCQVTVRPLDDLVPDRVDFLKIDVEGYEGSVLAGARRILKQDKPNLFLELHPAAIEQLGDDIEGMVRDIAETYSSVEWWRPPHPSDFSPLRRVIQRYTSGELPIRMTEAEIKECVENPSRCTGTAWLIAKR